MNMTDLFTADSKSILSNVNSGFATNIIIVDPVNGETTIPAIFNSYKGEVETNTGIPQIVQIPSISCDRSVLDTAVSDSILSELPKKGTVVKVTYQNRSLTYVITNPDYDLAMNMVSFMLRIKSNG